MTAENTCAFNNNKLFKKFEEKLAVTVQELLHVYLHRLMRKQNLLLPRQDVVYTSPHGGHQKFQGEGSLREGNFQGGGVRFSRAFFPGTLKQEFIIVFIDDLSLTVIAECFFHSLCHRLIMPVIQLVIALCFTI